MPGGRSSDPLVQVAAALTVPAQRGCAARCGVIRQRDRHCDRPRQTAGKLTRGMAGGRGRERASEVWQRRHGTLIYSKTDHLLKARIQGSARPSLASI